MSLQIESTRPNEALKFKKGPKAFLAGLALAATVVTMAGKPIGNKINDIQEDRAEYAELHKPGLADRIKDGNTPDVLQDDKLALVDIEQGDTAYQTMGGVAKDGRLRELSSYVLDQTQGQPGEAVVPVDMLNPETAQLVAGEHGGPLPTVVEK